MMKMRKLVIFVLSALVFSAAPEVIAQDVDPFARYTTPGQCEAAVRRLNNHYWRDKRADTVVYAPLTDSLPASVVQSARNCAKRFNVATIAERELLNLAQLYIMANQEPQAKAAIDRLLKAESRKSIVDRGWTLSLLSGSLLKAKPARVALARTYLAQLDALGDSVAAWKMFTHQDFGTFFLSINDRAAALSHAHASIAASKKMTHNDRLDWTMEIGDSYGVLAKLDAIEKGRHGGTAALAIYYNASDLSSIRSASWLNGIINGIKPIYTLQGTPAPAIKAAKWYNAAGDTLRPRRGRVSLLVFDSPSCGAECYPMYATIRRLHAKHGANLDIVVMARTGGFYRNQLMKSPLVEADSIGSYFTNFLRLPATVAVEETGFGYRPTDGRRINVQPVNEKNYNRGPKGILVDKEGVIQFLSNVSPDNESVLEFLIQRSINSN